jgi:biopolymer transport protein ExbD
MQFKRKLKKDASIEIAPLVDIVFLLLLFFVVTTTFREAPGLEIDLPETRDAAGVQLRDLVVNIVPTDGEALVYLGQEQVSFETLEAKLRAELAARPDDKKMVVVQADKNVRFELVFRAFDIARAAGATGISLPAEFRQEREE